MSEPVTFGLTPVRAARSAAFVALLGVAGVGAIARMVGREGSPLHAFLSDIGVSAPALFLYGGWLIVFLALIGARKALSTATQFAITGEGLSVQGPAGKYLLAWENIERLGTVFEKDLGVVVRDRGAVAATHTGTQVESERFGRLIAAEPYQGWDFHYFRHELGMPVDRVLFLLEQARNPKVLVTRLESDGDADSSGV